jgi:protein-S-isoprenylcysteine O-methyltransferase Ste14
MKLSLGTRIILRMAVVLPGLMALVFLTAGTWRYWQGWMFVAVLFCYASGVFAYYYRHDRAFVERRLRTEEQIGAQKYAAGVLKLLMVAMAALPGLDYRLGWSQRTWGAAPAWLSLLAEAAIVGGLATVFQVMKVNRYAAVTVEVEAGQTVVTSGPYAVVRHPMYTGLLAIFLAMPLALGSTVLWPASALLVPALMLRLLNEEKLLKRDLAGYEAYCRKTRFRLLPYVW